MNLDEMNLITLGKGYQREKEEAAFSHFLGGQMQPTGATQIYPDNPAFEHLNRNIEELGRQNKEIKEAILKLQRPDPFTFITKIYDLPSEKYRLKSPVDTILKIYTDEVIALVPELELHGEGINEFEAINDLKLELVDMITDFAEFNEDQLGSNAKSWKRTLDLMVEPC